MRQATRRFCRRCGFSIRAGKHTCSSCGGHNTASVGNFIEPTTTAKVPQVSPPYPWSKLVWPEGATISLAAPQGVGKSSISMVLNQSPELQIAAWITCEQDPYQVHNIARRLRVAVPPIWPVSTANMLDDSLRALEKVAAGPGSVIVFDSLTPLGLGPAVQMMNRLIADAREYGWRVVMINQTNKAEQIAGSAQLAFMPDIDVRLTQDKFARRRLYIGKNRYGGEFTAYFDFSDDGAVAMPDFSGIIHSVEGLNPNYELVPYGLADGSVPGRPGQARGRKVQWASILDPMAEFGLLPALAGYAAAGAESAATPSGFMEPPDVKYRREFAETHGLKWLSVDEIAVMLSNSEYEPLISRLSNKRKKDGAASFDKDLPNNTKKADADAVA